MKKILPLNDLVLIESLPVKDKTKSGIIIPETAKDKPNKGVVIAVGPGTSKYKMTLIKGDKVLYGKYTGTDLELNGKKYLIMHENEIFAKIEK